MFCMHQISLTHFLYHATPLYAHTNTGRKIHDFLSESLPQHIVRCGASSGAIFAFSGKTDSIRISLCWSQAAGIGRWTRTNISGSECGIFHFDRCADPDLFERKPFSFMISIARFKRRSPRLPFSALRTVKSDSGPFPEVRHGFAHALKKAVEIRISPFT